MNYGTKLRQLRDAHGYSQENVAHMLNVVQSTYSGWENGDHIPKWDILPKLADIYKLEIPALSKMLFEEGPIFHNHQQQGGNFQAASTIINNGSEQELKSLKEEMEALKQQIKALEKKSSKN
jgi:transcriptional regulator with XRE-family HTH domain